MANQPEQLEGNLQLAVAGSPLEDVSEWISEYRINRQRTMVKRPPNLKNATEVSAAGSKMRNLVIGMFSPTTAGSVLGLLREAIESDTAEIEFAGTMNDEPVGPDNPLYSGKAVVPQLDEGTVVGTLRSQTLTLPITEWNEPDVTP